MQEDDNCKQEPTIADVSEKSIDREISLVANQIIPETDADKIKSLMNLFNLNQAKKNMFRIISLSELQDKLIDNIKYRLTHDSIDFSNDELLKYLTAIDSSIEKAHKTFNEIDNIPLIQINQQNNVSIGVQETTMLDTESRQRVSDVINLILSQGSSLNEDKGD